MHRCAGPVVFAILPAGALAHQHRVSVHAYQVVNEGSGATCTQSFEWKGRVTVTRLRSPRGKSWGRP